VIVDVEDVPTLTAVGEVAVTVMSATVKVAVAECVTVPLVPVTVTVYAPDVVALHERVEVPEFVTLAGLKGPHVRPDGTVSVRLTTPVKPFMATIVTVEDTAELTVVPAALAEIEKSVTVKVALVE